jgi:hypothetical protein
MNAEEELRDIRGKERFYPKACSNCQNLEHMREFYVDYSKCLVDLEFGLLKAHYQNSIMWLLCTISLLAGGVMGYVAGIFSIPVP